MATCRRGVDADEDEGDAATTAAAAASKKHASHASAWQSSKPKKEKKQKTQYKTYEEIVAESGTQDVEGFQQELLVDLTGQAVRTDL